MNECLILLGLLAGCAPPQDTARASGPTARTAPVMFANAPHDPWLAEDKLQHFALSFGVTAFSYAAARTALDPDPALATAGIVALAAGVGKEIYDVRRGQHFSLRDLAWDAAGVALGLAFTHNIR